MKLGTSSPLAHATPEEWAANQIKLGCADTILEICSPLLLPRGFFSPGDFYVTGNLLLRTDCVFNIDFLILI